ncbi:hypothetical protein Pst134EA_005112 [Puccinia striiformis f. sp. tritici]|uniref:hypothetical protein n=1 Tax=Puccinia striiformis f. sp. tritici TaxID=168172 RepID=UPI0020089B97|nr:hypothetical protein Pst134EA_005112 [Puccinia striiformis f. sp. tritici]KAH9462264.1 hypothetical protein Pst134EB_006170 [Puccinia striiformis f. sp. tritici]KAH9471203.1 hypothetical protein Pst134EA_005112 [Puccinia striiformis f. sp. tritici]
MQLLPWFQIIMVLLIQAAAPSLQFGCGGVPSQDGRTFTKALCIMVMTDTRPQHGTHGPPKYWHVKVDAPKGPTSACSAAFNRESCCDQTSFIYPGQTYVIGTWSTFCRTPDNKPISSDQGPP